MRPLRFLGDSLKCLRDFPEGARHDAGYQLDKVQRGEQPDDLVVDQFESSSATISSTDQT